MTHLVGGGGVPPVEAAFDGAAVAATPARRESWWRRRLGAPVSAYDQRSAMVFLAPMMIVLMVVAVFPVLYSF
jgi:hypothetical protein